MAGTKRERELHRAKLARQEKEAAAASVARRRRLQIVAIIAVVALVIATITGIAIATGGDDDATTGSALTGIPPTSTAGVTCKPVNDKKPLTKKYDKVEASLIADGQYSQNVDTNCGRISFTTDVKGAPDTTKALAFLSDRQYFDNSLCHRLTTGGGNYVLQCGDPTGTGGGSPGFTVKDENLPTGEPKDENGLVVYPRGIVAMANAGPNTTGSQFFIVYQDSTFPPNYTVIGKVTEGMNIVDYIAAQGTKDGGPDGAPKQPLQITKMQSSATVEQEVDESIIQQGTGAPQ